MHRSCLRLDDKNLSRPFDAQSEEQSSTNEQLKQNFSQLQRDEIQMKWTK